MSLTGESTIPEGLMPEERKLFEDFQAYVHTISDTSSQITQAKLQKTITQLETNVDHLAARLKKQGEELEMTVAHCREQYEQLFAPAVQEFRSSALATTRDMQTMVIEDTQKMMEQSKLMISQSLSDMREQNSTAQKRLYVSLVVNLVASVSVLCLLTWVLVKK